MKFLGFSIFIIGALAAIYCYIMVGRFEHNSKNFSNNKKNKYASCVRVLSKDAKEDSYLKTLIYRNDVDGITQLAKNDIKNHRYYYFIYGLGYDAAEEDLFYNYAKSKHNLTLINLGDASRFDGADKYDSIMGAFLERRKIPQLFKIRRDALNHYHKKIRVIN